MPTKLFNKIFQTQSRFIIIKKSFKQAQHKNYCETSQTKHDNLYEQTYITLFVFPILNLIEIITVRSNSCSNQSVLSCAK